MLRLDYGFYVKEFTRKVQGASFVGKTAQNVSVSAIVWMRDDHAEILFVLGIK